MHQMKVAYLGGYRTEAQHLDSKNKLITDAPKDNQGKGEAFSPTDLMCTSLASCMLTIMAMKGKALGHELEGMTVEVEKKMQAAPRKVSEIVLRFDWKDNFRNLPRGSLHLGRFRKLSFDLTGRGWISVFHRPTWKN